MLWQGLEGKEEEEEGGGDSCLMCSRLTETQMDGQGGVKEKDGKGEE
jgi:hypothetical protein